MRTSSIGSRKYLENSENKIINASAIAVKAIIIWDTLLFSFNSQDLNMKKFIKQD